MTPPRPPLHARLSPRLSPLFLAIGLAVVALGAVLFIPHIELRKTMEEVTKRPEPLREAA